MERLVYRSILRELRAIMDINSSGRSLGAALVCSWPPGNAPYDVAQIIPDMLKGGGADSTKSVETIIKNVKTTHEANRHTYRANALLFNPTLLNSYATARDAGTMVGHSYAMGMIMRERLSTAHADSLAGGGPHNGSHDLLDIGLETLRHLSAYRANMETLDTNEHFQPIRRPREDLGDQASGYDPVELCVGDVIMHRYFGVCVVYGWDMSCQASEEWIQAHDIQRLLHGVHQPFYHVLCHDGTERYVSQEKVERCTSTKHPVLPGKKNVVGHRNIPLYFESENAVTDSTGSIRYLPNGHLTQHYPDEEVARERRERRKQLKRKTASVQAQLDLLAAPLNVPIPVERPTAAATAMEQPTGAPSASMVHRAANGEDQVQDEGDRETIHK